MAFQAFRTLIQLRNPRFIIHNVRTVTNAIVPKYNVENKRSENQTEEKLVFLDDPDTFGNLSRKIIQKNISVDDDDKKEEEFLQNRPLPSQKLTTKKYADLIKQFLKHKRLKEAIDVLEERMLKVDRVKPENYIYNILIGACAEVGYTKKAFKLYNDMKRRALKPTGDTYTCLFTACVNSPWPAYGLKNAQHLRNLMIEKGIEPNLTNYNAMIKAFGRCGDLSTAFKLVDEMLSKKIKIRVHTFNHLLQACISDKEHGLRHALLVWRKMLTMREKPNIYSFNLMLKCVKECNLGPKNDIEELLGTIADRVMIMSTPSNLLEPEHFAICSPNDIELHVKEEELKVTKTSKVPQETTESSLVPKPDDIEIRILDTNVNKTIATNTAARFPNLLSKTPDMSRVLSLQEIKTVQEKFLVVGGQEEFLHEMKNYNVKPDIKSFTQMLMVINDTDKAELQLMDSMKSEGVIADINFYNTLIKKRCLRMDYDGAFEVMKIIEEESQLRKKKHFLKKKLQLKPDVMTYGALAMACKTKEQCHKFLEDMKEKQLKVNTEILGTLLRQGTAHNDFGYIMHIMSLVKDEKLPVNKVFLKHLENFNDKCAAIITPNENGETKCTNKFIKGHKKYLDFYTNWLKTINIDVVLEPENPWEQFQHKYPDTVQRQNINIEEPKRSHRARKKYVRYTPRI